MKILTAGVTSAMLAVGIAGSVVAYRTQVEAVDNTRPVAETTTDVVPLEAPASTRAEVRWAPCPEGSTLEKETCVRDLVRTIVLPAPAPTAQAAATPQAVATSRPQDESDDRDDDHEDDHEDDDQDDSDDGDDDHEDDDHEDDDHDEDED